MSERTCETCAHASVCGYHRDVLASPPTDRDPPEWTERNRLCGAGLPEHSAADEQVAASLLGWLETGNASSLAIVDLWLARLLPGHRVGTLQPRHVCPAAPQDMICCCPSHVIAHVDRLVKERDALRAEVGKRYHAEAEVERLRAKIAQLRAEKDTMRDNNVRLLTDGNAIRNSAVALNEEIERLRRWHCETCPDFAQAPELCGGCRWAIGAKK